MVITSRIISIGIIIASFAIGLVSYYLLSDFPKKEKKKHIDEVTSQLINFVIFIWVGKIVLNLSLFLQEPVTVLAYPADSGAFYLAVLFTAITIVYKSIRKNLDLRSLADVFAHVFLVASFIYEFTQLVLENSQSPGYLVLLAILLIGFVSMRERLTTTMLLITVLIGWTAGVLVLTFIQPFVTIFGYMIDPWFIGLFFIGCLSIMYFSKRKRDA